MKEITDLDRRLHGRLSVSDRELVELVEAQQRALDVLHSDPRFDWLCHACAERQERVSRSVILARLGRISDPEDIKALAEQLCECRPSTDVALSMIRRCRSQSHSPRDTIHLAKEIIRTINDFVASRPTANEHTVLKALRRAKRAVEAGSGNR